MKTIESILNSVSDKIYERGLDYYRSGRILNIESDSAGNISAEVEGSEDEPYNVFIEFDENGGIEYFDCDCPYDYSPVCKHIAAVLLALNEGNCPKSNENNLTIDQRLEALSKDELINILAALADSDYKIREKLNNKLNMMLDKDYDIEDLIDSIIDDYSESDGYVNYYSCYDMCMEIVDVINNEFDCFEEDNSLKHIQNLILINRKLINIMDCCDDSDGGLSTALSEVDRNLHNACMTVYNSKAEKDCMSCLDMLCAEAENKVYDYWNEARYNFINIAVLFSKYNEKAVSKAVDSLVRQCRKDGRYYYGNAVLLKSQFIRKTHGDEKADEFLFANIDCDGVCEFLVKRYIDEEKYEEAEKLCLDKLKDADNPNFWNSLLSSIYEKSGQLNKQLNIELNDLLGGNARKYYTVKKLMIKLGLWKKSYNSLISELSSKLPAYSYAEILKNEGEYEKLLSLVKSHRYLLKDYFKTIAKKYPEESFAMFYEYIVFTAKQSGSRPEYQSVCSEIAVLYNAGGKEKAKQLINFLKNEYKRKPAFQDELRKLNIK